MDRILSEEFLNQYKGVKSPLSHIGEFVYLRTYSRYLEDKKRRENWFETVYRTTEYNIGLGLAFKEKNHIPVDMEAERAEAEVLFDHLFHLRTFPSGRTLYMGGTEIVEKYPLSNYNCCFTMIDTMQDFVDVFYLLMVGCGVGVRIDRERTAKLPVARKITVESRYKAGVREFTPLEDMENTTHSIDSKNPKRMSVKIGDSKEGWCQALALYYQVVFTEDFREVDTMVMDYSYVRPEGERLKRFGGRASGHASLMRMFDKMNKVFHRRADGRLQSIDILDLATIISENVVSGGVRRSAMMVICDPDDTEVIEAKREIYRVVEGQWIEDAAISHRKMSNNSILYQERPSRERIQEIIHSIRINGEPGFINGAEAKRRKPTFMGCNPCGEILLQPKQCCNLTTNNMVAFVDETGILDEEGLTKTIRLSVRVAIRMTLVDVELPEWDKVMKEDPIIGVSLTGMMDMCNRTGMDVAKLADLLARLRKSAHEEGREYCRQLGIPAPELMTTIKPEGTLSTLPCVSSGIHFAHSDYYIRRVRIAVSDPLFKMIEKQGSYPIHNENGQTDENCTIKVIEFPIKAPKGRTKFEVGAIEQLELYKMTMENWTDHNTSITVHVREHEWEAVADWVYENFQCVVGITFLPLLEETYPLLPFECTTREDYEERMKAVKPVDYDLLAELEDDEEHDLLDQECATGVCPVR